MSVPKRIIQHTPIKDYQLGTHLTDYKRDKQLTKADIAAMLQTGPVWFAIADVGHELHLIEPEQCFKFWKLGIKEHLADVPSRLEDFPDEYFYFASHWVAEGARPIILLEKHH